jgi:hypothetical protein
MIMMVERRRGRPPKCVQRVIVEKVRELRGEGHSFRKIGDMVGLSHVTCWRYAGDIRLQLN